MPDRAKVIKALEDFNKNRICLPHLIPWDEIADAIALLKEREAENGEWITIWREDDPDTSSHAICSVCNRVSERPLGGYCKWCGAKMMGEWGVGG